MIAWFVRNGVAANLLMFVIVIGGFVSLNRIKMELFPEFSLDTITVKVPYRGSAPEEVEEAICIRIEEKIQDIEGIKKMTSRAQEGSGIVIVEVERGYDPRSLLDDIKVRVDAIDTFPEDTEKPIVEENLITREVLSVAVVGNTDEKTLKRLAERIRDELTQLPGITQVKVAGIRDFEIAIEVSEENLRRYSLKFENIAQAIRKSSLDLPGGTIKAAGGEILLRSKAQAYTGKDFERIVLIPREDGTRVTIGDVATVIDDFEDEPLTTMFNGKPSAIIRVFEVGDQSPLDISENVEKYVKEAQPLLPPGVELILSRDNSFYLKGRLNMLVQNGVIGLLLVFSTLTLFLRPSLAIWVTLGIPISFLGAFIMLPFVDVSINLISLFGFIMVLGIVVDDAIVVGESVFSEFQKNGPSVAATIAGAKAVAIPVTFAVMTTIVAFIPILFIPGFLGKILTPIPAVVIFTLLFSLVESKVILPYHLSLCKVGEHKRKQLHKLQRVQRICADALERFVERVYRPTLAWVLPNRYLTLSIFLGIFAIMLGTIANGWLKFVFFPAVPSDYIIARLTMIPGVPVSETRKAVEKMMGELDVTFKELEKEGIQSPIDNIMVTVGAQPFAGGPNASSSDAMAANIAEIMLELVKSEKREVSAPALTARWREAIGPIPGAEELSFTSTAAGSQGMPIDIQLTGTDFEKLQAAGDELKRKLTTYEGLFDIADNYSGGKRELKLKIKPSAEVLGLNQIDLARQVRQAFYGEEAQRIQRGRDDIRVMVRYPKSERQSLGNLENMRIRTPAGLEVPFSQVAAAEMGRGSTTINRVDRQRAINVKADADKAVADLKAIKEDLRNVFIPELIRRYPGIFWSFEGEAREQSESLSSLAYGFVVVLCIIYALMAIPFRSYTQPLIIMSVVPFGLVGAVLGHLVLMRDFSVLSVLGCLALTGVVVNDSLVMVDYINRQHRGGKPLLEAVWDSGAARFRPIFLTSLTTFLGLSPILLESSLQAQFLIPMAISLAFGVLFATLITLILVPACYLILEDIRKGLRIT